MEVQLHVDVPKGWNSDHENKIHEILCNGPWIRENLYPRNIPAIRYDLHNYYNNNITFWLAYNYNQEHMHT